MASNSLWLLAGLSLFSFVQCSEVAPQCKQGANGKRACLDEHTSLMQTITKVEKGSKVEKQAVKDVSSTAKVEKHAVEDVSATAKVEKHAGKDVNAKSTKTGMSSSSTKSTANASRVTYAVKESAPALPYTRSAARNPPGWEEILGQIFVSMTGVSLLSCIVLAYCGVMKKWFAKPKGMTPDKIESFQKSWKYYFILMSVMCVSGFTTSQYVPSMTRMQVDFGTVPVVMSATLQAGWFAKACSALVMPWYAEQFGKVRMLMFCSMLLAVGSLGCGTAPDLFWFFTSRVFQGIGQGGETIIFMMVRDIYETSEKRMNYMSTLMFSLILVPMAAPALGGLGGHFVGWRVPFYCLYGWSILNAVLLYFILPETTPVGEPERTAKEYAEETNKLMHDKHMQALIVAMGIGLMICWSVDTNLSLIFGNVYKMGELEITWKMAFIGMSFSLAMVEVWYIKSHMHWRTVTMLRSSTLGALVPGVFGVLMFFIPSLATQFWLGLMCDFSVFIGFFVFLSAQALFMQPVKDMSGPAAGLMTFATTLIGVIGTIESSIEAYLEDNKVTSLTFFQGTMFIIMPLAFWYEFGYSPPDWALEEETHEDENPTEGKDSLQRGLRNRGKADDDDDDKNCCAMPKCIQNSKVWKTMYKDDDEMKDEGSTLKKW